MMTLPRPLLFSLALAVPCISQAENLTPNLKFNGFATASTAILTDDQGGEYLRDINGYPGLTEDPTFGLESLIGLQFDYRVNSQVNVVTQLVAQGRNNYKAEAEWAYIGYQINDSWRLRGGRFALPTFMFSDTIHVGQSYPWVRLPAEPYFGVPVTNFDGADLLYRQPLGDWNLNAQLLLGGSNTDMFRTENARGINIGISNDNLTVRAGVIDSELTLPVECSLPAGHPMNPLNPLPLPFPLTPCPLDIKEAPTLFSNIGTLYDDGTWFVAAELSQLKVDGWINDWNAGYVSVGHYFGKWLPYLLWSRIHTFNVDDCTTGATAGFCNAARQYNEQTTHAIGAKYALSGNVSLKGQYDYVNGFSNTEGFLSNGPTPPDAFGVFTLSLTAAF